MHYLVKPKTIFRRGSYLQVCELLHPLWLDWMHNWLCACQCSRNLCCSHWCSFPSLALPLCQQWDQWLRAMHLFLFKMHREWQLWCGSSCLKKGMCATSMPWNCAAKGKKPPIATVVCFDVYVPESLSNVVLGCSSWEHEAVVTQDLWSRCLFLELL